MSNGLDENTLARVEQIRVDPKFLTYDEDSEKIGSGSSIHILLLALFLINLCSFSSLLLLCSIDIQTNRIFFMPEVNLDFICKVGQRLI